MSHSPNLGAAITEFGLGDFLVAGGREKSTQGPTKKLAFLLVAKQGGMKLKDMTDPNLASRGLELASCLAQH